MKTPIRWAGSKKTLLPLLRQFWSAEYSRYVEPFCGSACFFFDVEPKKAILGDINGELITTYKALKANPESVLRHLKSVRKTKASYYAVRSSPIEALPDAKIAARFIFLNRYCFNGIYRTNLRGEFNVPYATPKGPSSFDFEALQNMAKLLKRANLFECDFEAVIDKVRNGDFVYLDPPYAVARRRIFSEYHPDAFSGDDLSRLEASLLRIDRVGARFVISYADSAEGRDLLARWNPRRIRTKRNVAGFVGDRRSAYELIASNRELPNAD